MDEGKGNQEECNPHSETEGKAPYFSQKFMDGQIGNIGTVIGNGTSNIISEEKVIAL